MRDSLHKKIEIMLSTQIQCVLATCKKNVPAQHLMAYAYSKDLSEIYFASLNGTRKVNNIIENDNVSIIWDNRTGDPYDHNYGMLVTGSGYAKLESNSTRDSLKIEFSTRNPTLKLFLDKPECIIISVHMERYWVVEGQETTGMLNLN